MEALPTYGKISVTSLVGTIEGSAVAVDDFVQVSRGRSAAGRAQFLLHVMSAATRVGPDWPFIQIKRLLLLLSVVPRVWLLEMGLSQHLPFLGGRYGADGEDEQKCGQNVSLVNDEGSGEEGGRGRRHAAWAAATKRANFVTDYLPVTVIIVVDVVVACVVLFLRCWTSC